MKTDKQNYETALKFITSEFLALNANPHRPIYSHTFSAVDTENVRLVFFFFVAVVVVVVVVGNHSFVQLDVS